MIVVAATILIAVAFVPVVVVVLAYNLSCGSFTISSVSHSTTTVMVVQVARVL